ncbi:hypothetical protein QBC34DRAFT_404703 [Podospora aff. communis PSN243]|uniref:Uncharacterized protein n=1 Tax=Podospora aff. communis PSN243 TaxID=3040156 RepID=A0AAV9GQV2_9PEZI|nr:hypothetical protein QBC34DRAFT_404703 [Podospora aff. communis PSN243]
MGVTGWLRVCRTAHAEGVDVLYATNVFNVANLEVTYALPCVMSRLNRARIQHAQLEWGDLLPWPKRYEWAPEDEPQEPVRLGVVDPTVGCRKAIYFGMRAFSEPFSMLSLWLPSLRFLYLSLSGAASMLPSKPRKTNAKEICDSLESLLVHVDNAFVAFQERGQFSHWCIALPSDIYIPLKLRWTESEGRHQCDVKSGAIWKSVVSGDGRGWEVDEVEVETQDPNVEAARDSGLTPAAHRCGYWVMENGWDVLLPSPPGHRLSRAARVCSYLAT